jgi:hypothetical protein
MNVSSSYLAALTARGRVLDVDDEHNTRDANGQLLAVCRTAAHIGLHTCLHSTTDRPAHGADSATVTGLKEMDEKLVDRAIGNRRVVGLRGHRPRVRRALHAAES